MAPGFVGVQNRLVKRGIKHIDFRMGQDGSGWVRMDALY